MSIGLLDLSYAPFPYEGGYLMITAAVNEAQGHELCSDVAMQLGSYRAVFQNGEPRPLDQPLSVALNPMGSLPGVYTDRDVRGIPSRTVNKEGKAQCRCANPGKTEFLVRVERLNTASEDRSVNEVGLFRNENTVRQPTLPKWKHTVQRWEARFPTWQG